uniref:Uncharacterized protein n=1 Tax=Arundo donax TaxID=35708 RepID=A0A0A9HBG0_ARUDO
MAQWTHVSQAASSPLRDHTQQPHHMRNRHR